MEENYSMRRKKKKKELTLINEKKTIIHKEKKLISTNWKKTVKKIKKWNNKRITTENLMKVTDQNSNLNLVPVVWKSAKECNPFVIGWICGSIVEDSQNSCIHRVVGCPMPLKFKSLAGFYLRKLHVCFQLNLLESMENFVNVERTTICKLEVNFPVESFCLIVCTTESL